MSSPGEQTMITCPKCSEEYGTWYRASMNRTRDPGFDDAYTEKMSTGICPKCGFNVDLGTIVTEMHRSDLNIWPAPG